MDFTTLPFEYEGRYGDLYRDLGLSMEQAAVLEQRDRDLEDYLAASVVPLAFHWHGSVSAHVDKRNGPGEFGEGGFIHRIRYRWDTPSTTGATVQWRLDDTVAFTHSVTSDDPYVEVPAHPYAQEAIVAVVTAVGSDGAGLSAFVYLA